MNYRDILFLDFETTDKNPHKAQPIQLAAVLIHGQRLEIVEDSVFNTYIEPIWDEEECKKLGLTPYNSEITKITGITEEQLKKEGLALKTAWKDFTQYIAKYNPKKDRWSAPVKAGANIRSYDNIIIDRICGGHFCEAKRQLDILQAGGIIEEVKLPEPYGFGPWDDDRQEEALFFPRDSIDIQRIIWLWTENMPEIKSLSMDATREWLNMSSEGAHNAVKDVIDGAKILIRFMRFHRMIAGKTKFKKAFAND